MACVMRHRLLALQRVSNLSSAPELGSDRRLLLFMVVFHITHIRWYVAEMVNKKKVWAKIGWLAF